MTDQTTLAATLASDLAGAFPAYVRETIDGVYSGALRMLGNSHDAEDIVQDTYARAFRALSSYEADRIRDLSVAGWTWTIAANLCRNRLRSRARKPTLPLGDEEFPANADVSEEALSGIGLALRHALLELPFPQRAAVVLRHVVDLAYEDIAVALERPVGTVKSDVHRGLERLRQIYTKEEQR